MAKWLVAIGALVVALGVLLWQLATPPESRPVSAQPASAQNPDSAKKSDSSNNQQGSSNAGPRTDVAPENADQEEPEIEMLVPGTPEFGHRMDVVYTDNFKEALAPCYKGGLDGNLQLRITYQMHIVGGEIYATDVKVADSEINNRAIEDCMVAAVRELRWTAEDVPDWTEDQELFIRLRTLKKYASRQKMFEDDYKTDEELDEELANRPDE